MSHIDLDEMRNRWQQAHARAEPSLAFDLQALRATLARTSGRAFARHGRWLLLGWLGNSAVLLALLAFLAGHWSDAIYRLLATPLAVLSGWQWGVSLQRWLALRRLDLSSPVIALQQQLERLRDRQVAVTRAILLSSVLLWLPLILVSFKGLLGVDLLDHLHPSVIWVNLGLGLLVLLLGDAAWRWWLRRGHGSEAQRRALQEWAGHSWQRAEQSVQAQLALEARIAARGADAVAAEEARAEARRQRLAAPLRQLRGRLLLAALCYALLVLLTGAWTVTHGGQWSLLVPGVLLNYGWIALMVSAIVHRVGLLRLDLAAEPPVLRDRLQTLASQHRAVAGAVLVASPLLLSLLAVILVAACWGLDLFASLDPAGWSGLLAGWLLAAGWLYRRVRQGRLGSAVSLLTLGAERCVARLMQHAADSSPSP